MTFQKMTAADVMSRVRETIPEHAPLEAAARLMAEGRSGGAAPVTDLRGRCVGLLLAADLARGLADGNRRGPDASAWSEWQMTVPAEGNEVPRLMNPAPLTLKPDTPLPEVARLVLTDASRRAVVVDRQYRPVGLLSAADVFGAFHRCETDT
jgi:CBS domain-containing protein